MRESFTTVEFKEGIVIYKTELCDVVMYRLIQSLVFCLC